MPLVGVFLLLPFKINLQMKAKRTVFGKSFIVLFFSLISSLFFSFSPRVDGFIRTGSSVVGSAAGAMIGSAARTAAGAAAHFNLLYDSLGLDALELSRAAFEHAVKGFLALQQAGEIRNTDVPSCDTLTP